MLILMIMNYSTWIQYDTKLKEKDFFYVTIGWLRVIFQCKQL